MGSLSSSPKVPDPPPPPPVVEMPDETALNRERKRKQAEMQQRSGRESTILTGGDKLGG